VVYHVYLQHGTLGNVVCGYMETLLKSEPVTADLTTTVVHTCTGSYKWLINDIKPLLQLCVITLYKTYNKLSFLTITTIRPDL